MPADLTLPIGVQDWLLTYLLHSTILLGSLWLLTRLLRGLPAAWQESLWRTALLGGLLTASLHVALGVETFAGRVRIAAVAPAITAPVEVEPAVSEPPPVTEWRSLPIDPAPVVAAPTAPAPEPPPAATTPEISISWPQTLAVLWVAGVLLALLRHVRARRRLSRDIASREPLPDGPLHAMLSKLNARARGSRAVRLTHAPTLSCPVALGILRPEICVPTRVIEDLTPAQQEVMLAHELAHHRRRDPLWLAVSRWLETLLFFQPLNIVAGRRLRAISEILCDAWAVERTGLRRPLAECLARVAEWMLHARRTLPASTMALRGGAALERRVRRLLDGETEGSRRRGRTLLAVLPLVLVGAFAPGVGRTATAAPARAEESPPTAPPLAPIEAPDDVHAAARALDAEIAALRADLVTLTDLLEQVEAVPPALGAGVLRIKERLAALEAGRASLLERISQNLELER